MLLGPLAVEVGQHHLRPGRGETPAVLLAAAAGAPGDDRDLAVQREALDAHRIPLSSTGRSTGRLVDNTRTVLGAMKIGVMLAGVNPKFWTAAAQAAEDAGFESVWLPEHLVFPVEMKGSPHAGDSHPPIPSNTPAFDALHGAGGDRGDHEERAARHQRLQHRAASPVRHRAGRSPPSTCISGGRVEFGIGASWLEEEWEATGLDFSTRGRRVDESIDICRRLWTDDVVEHHGEFFDFAPVMFNPKPVQQPQPSLLIGGDGAAAKRRAALVGDGWLPMNHSLEQLPGALAEINEKRAAAGREGTTTLTVGGSIDSLADVDRYRDADVDRVLVRPFIVVARSPRRHRPLRRRDHRQARPDPLLHEVASLNRVGRGQVTQPGVRRGGGR